MLIARRQIIAVDLCCGGGGWACAARGLPIRIVAAVDFWDTACRTYKLNHPETEVICGDLRDGEVRSRLHDACKAAGGVDLVLGGVPCEWLSVRRNVGKAVTEAERENERATLAGVLGLVDELDPTYWCLEDVAGIVEELPQGTPWREIDSRAYSAQRRKRVYVGEFPRPPGGSCAEKLSRALRTGPYRIGKRVADRQIVRHTACGRQTVQGAWADRKGPTVCCFGSRRDADLVIVDDAVPGGRRQIEWQEAAELQGFPEHYVFYGSPTDVWKMIGRAIQIDTGRAILREIVRDWCGTKRQKRAKPQAGPVTTRTSYASRSRSTR